MYKGEPANGPDFFALLYASDEFCAQLGRTVLAAGQLESELKFHIDSHFPKRKGAKDTLGSLVSFAKTNKLLDDLIPDLEMLKKQRNYLTHNIHALLFGLIEETILEGRDLLDSDVHTYIERAWDLEQNLKALTKMIIDENRKRRITPIRPPEVNSQKSSE